MVYSDLLNDLDTHTYPSAPQPTSCISLSTPPQAPRLCFSGGLPPPQIPSPAPHSSAKTLGLLQRPSTALPPGSSHGSLTSSCTCSPPPPPPPNTHTSFQEDLSQRSLQPSLQLSACFTLQQNPPPHPRTSHVTAYVLPACLWARTRAP